MKITTLLLFTFLLSSSFGAVNTMTFNGTSTTTSGVNFSFSTGAFVGSSDGTSMSLYSNHPYATPVNGGNDYKDITISQTIYITKVNVSWAVNVDGFKLQFLNGTTVVKELSSLTVGDIAVNVNANFIRFYDAGISNSGGFELASVTWDGAMPVELVSFGAKIIDQNVQLKWKTATEINNYGFEVERCNYDSKYKANIWSIIGFVIGNGNSNSPKEYLFMDTPIIGSSFKYRLKQIDFDGQFEYSGEVDVVLNPPAEFSLHQNYPNPFNPTTKIKYELPKDYFVKVKIFDSIGREVFMLAGKNESAGFHEISFDGRNFPAGIYFYQIQADDFIQTKKMILIK